MREYAAAVEQALGGFEGRLLLEPGRFLVAQAGALVARVLQVKRNGKKTFVITDAAMNDLIRPALYQAHHEIVPVRRRAGKSAVGGCGGAGVRDGRLFCARPQAAPVEPGDLVALLDAGAYGMAQSSNYNTRPRAAEVLVEGAKARLIRRRETMADLLAPEMLTPDDCSREFCNSDGAAVLITYSAGDFRMQIGMQILCALAGMGMLLGSSGCCAMPIR